MPHVVRHGCSRYEQLPMVQRRNLAAQLWREFTAGLDRRPPVSCLALASYIQSWLRSCETMFPAVELERHRVRTLTSLDLQAHPLDRVAPRLHLRVTSALLQTPPPFSMANLLWLVTRCLHDLLAYQTHLTCAHCEQQPLRIYCDAGSNRPFLECPGCLGARWVGGDLVEPSNLDVRFMTRDDLKLELTSNVHLRYSLKLDLNTDPVCLLELAPDGTPRVHMSVDGMFWARVLAGEPGRVEILANPDGVPWYFAYEAMLEQLERAGELLCEHRVTTEQELLAAQAPPGWDWNIMIAADYRYHDLIARLCIGGLAWALLDRDAGWRVTVLPVPCCEGDETACRVLDFGQIISQLVQARHQLDF